MAQAPKLHECEHVLIVEGYSDLQFCVAFLRHLKREKGVYIHQFEGKSNILKPDSLRTFLTAKLLAEKKTIGIVIDADQNAEGTAHALRDRLLKIASREVNEGIWHEQADEARLGFFIAPDGVSAGEIETLAWAGLPEDEKHGKMKTTVDAFIDQMKALGWKPQSPDKARVGAYLAVAYDEDPRLGPGAREGKFPFDTQGFARLRTFLEVLPINE